MSVRCPISSTPGPSPATPAQPIPAASRPSGSGPADQSPPPNPGLISGIQATDELTGARGPAPQGSGDTGPAAPSPDTATTAKGRSTEHCTAQHIVLPSYNFLVKASSESQQDLGDSRSCQWLTLTRSQISAFAHYGLMFQQTNVLLPGDPALLSILRAYLVF